METEKTETQIQNEILRNDPLLNALISETVAKFFKFD